MKILDIVKFNSGVAFVVDKMPVLTYEKMTAPVSACKGEYEKFVFAWREFLIGSDESGVFYDVLYHRKESGPKAFGGHEFSLPMRDGGTFKTDGWWWDGGSTVAARMLGIEMGRVTIQDLPSLEKCFVFTAQYVDVKMFDEQLYCPFVKEHGKIEPKDYSEFEREVKFAGSKMVMPKKYIDARGWKYQVMPGIGENAFKARYQRPEKNGDIGWKGLAAVPWRGSREEAQTDLDRLAAEKGWVEWNG